MPCIALIFKGGNVSQQRLTRRDAARFLGIDEKTLYRRAKEGLIKTYEDPLDRRRTLFDLKDLKKLRNLSARALN
jgi:predicted site-specific integrase-resolvase